MDVTVEAGVDRTITADEVNALIASGEDLVKKGGGRFIIDQSLAGYKGEIRVEEGFLRCAASYALGDDDKGTIVSDGATLEFGRDYDGGKNGDFYLSPDKHFEDVQVVGNGVNGVGALYHFGTKYDEYCAVFRKITLNGDTRFGAATNSSGAFKRFDVRGGQGTLSLNGHTLTLACSFGICLADIVPDLGDSAGRIVVDGEKATLIYEGGFARFNGSERNVLELRNGATLSSQAGMPAIAWSLVADNGLFRNSGVSSNADAGRLTGPVTVKDGGLTLISGVGARLTLDGKISGTGRLTAYGKYHTAEFHLLNRDSDWTGGMTAKGTDNGFARVFVHPILQESDVAGRYSVEGAGTGMFDCVLASGDDAGMFDCYDNLAKNIGANAARLYVADGVAATNASDIAENSHVYRVRAEGGNLTLKGSQQDARLYVMGNSSGEVAVTGSEKTHDFRDISVTGNGILAFRDAGRIETGTNHVSVGGSYPALPWMKFENTLYTTNWSMRPIVTVEVNGKPVTKADRLPLLRVGPVRDDTVDGYSIKAYGGGRGVIEVGEGAFVTNVFLLGYPNEQTESKKTCHGSLFVRGGTVALVYDRYNYDYTCIGRNGSGCLELSSGTVNALSNVYPGMGQRGRGTVYVKGGEMTFSNGNLIFGQGSRKNLTGRSTFYQTGGDVLSYNAVIMGKTLWDEANAGSRDQLTVAGGTFRIDNNIDLGGEPYSTSILNLNGGTFRCHYVQMVTNECQTMVGDWTQRGKNYELTNSFGYVNFNGGTLQFARNANKSNRPGYQAGGFFYGDPERLRITSYGRGARFDTAGGTVTNRHSICAPTGMGIVSIALPASIQSLPDWAYAGAPVVEIDGDGTGASAVAEFDSSNGRVTGVTVTSPGCDYTTATAKLVRGGFTNDVPLTVALGESVSGGITKAGEGTLLMEVANTYAGPTRVEGGTLVVAHAGAIPSDSAIEIAGGAIDFGGYARDFGALTVEAGAIENVFGTMDSLVKTGDGVFLLNAPIAVNGMIDVQGGTLRLPAVTPGLVAGEVRIDKDGKAAVEAAWKANAQPDNLGADLEPSLAYEPCVTDGYYATDHYVSYAGYVWNRESHDVKWTFAFAFDDILEIYLDGCKLSTVKNGTAAWGALYTATVTLTPGSHAFHLKLRNAAGNGGAAKANDVGGVVNWRSDIIGFAYDPKGQDSTNGVDYVHMADPGDGSLFTRMPYGGSTLPTFDALRMAPGTTLDLFGGVYALTSELRVAAAADPIAVNGRLVFGEGAMLTVEDIDGLDRENAPYVLATATNGFGGTLPELSNANWRLRLLDDGKTLVLKARRGTAIVVR